jgi:hypothetical protein
MSEEAVGRDGDPHVIGGVDSNKLPQAFQRFRREGRHVVQLEISADLEQALAPVVNVLKLAQTCRSPSTLGES